MRTPSGCLKTRDVRLAEALASRDLRLRALPAAAWAYQKYDDELAVAREARALLWSWRTHLSVITNEAAEAEKEEFSRFRNELQKIKA